MTQNTSNGSVKNAANEIVDYVCKLLIIGNSSVGKTSLVCYILLYKLFFGTIIVFSFFDIRMIHFHQYLLVHLELILKPKI